MKVFSYVLGSERSPITETTPLGSARACSALRVRTRTLSPFWRRPLTIALPTVPVPPSTRCLIRSYRLRNSARGCAEIFEPSRGRRLPPARRRRVGEPFAPARTLGELQIDEREGNLTKRFGRLEADEKRRIGRNRLEHAYDAIRVQVHRAVRVDRAAVPRGEAQWKDLLVGVVDLQDEVVFAGGQEDPLEHAGQRIDHRFAHLFQAVLRALLRLLLSGLRLGFSVGSLLFERGLRKNLKPDVLRGQSRRRDRRLVFLRRYLFDLNRARRVSRGHVGLENSLDRRKRLGLARGTREIH